MRNYEVRFFESRTGQRPVAEFLKNLKRQNPKAWKKCLQYLKALEEHGLSLPLAYQRHIEGPVRELRPEFGGVEYRLFFGTVAPKRFGVVSAFQKTWESVPENIKREAAERIREMAVEDG